MAFKRRKKYIKDEKEFNNMKDYQDLYIKAYSVIPVLLIAGGDYAFINYLSPFLTPLLVGLVAGLTALISLTCAYAIYESRDRFFPEIELGTEPWQGAELGPQL